MKNISYLTQRANDLSQPTILVASQPMTTLKFNLLPPSQFDGIGHSSASGLGLELREGLVSLRFLPHCIMLPAAFSTAGAICKLSGSIPALWQHLAAEEMYQILCCYQRFGNVRNETCCPVLIPTAADVPHRVALCESRDGSTLKIQSFDASNHCTSMASLRKRPYSEQRSLASGTRMALSISKAYCTKSPHQSWGSSGPGTFFPEALVFYRKDILPIQAQISMIQIPHISAEQCPILAGPNAARMHD